MNSLIGAHAGETATIVGRGPSLLTLTRGDFSPGPVVVLNHAILAVRTLGLPNVIYAMQKDGCIPHVSRHTPVPLGCICPSDRMTPPLPTERLLLSAAESSRCFPMHPLRYVFDVQRDFGLPWNTMSAPVAVRIAQAMGCGAIRMFAHDAYTSGDTRRVDGGVSVVPGSNGYERAGSRAAQFAADAGLGMEWR